MGNWLGRLFDSDDDDEEEEPSEMALKAAAEQQRLIELEVQRRLAEQKLREAQKATAGTYFGPATAMPMVPGKPMGPTGFPINIRTRGPVGPWHPVGLIYTKNPADNKMMRVEGQIIDIGRRRFRYQFRNPKTGIAVPYKGGKEVYELIDGDIIPPIPGLESLGPWVYQETKHLVLPGYI